jgi:type IV pilus assembly protein PilC
MPQFEYKVKRGPGDMLSGTLEAESQRAAVARLRDMGYFPISVDEYQGDGKNDVLRKALQRVKLQERNLFFRQLANLIESGMPITRALSTLREQATNPRLVHVVETLRDDVQKGSSFADAMEQHPKIFPAMYTNMVRAGETGGMMEEVLWRIVEFGEQEEELRGKAISAMVYPAFLLFIGTAAIFILVSFVFPKFVGIFEEFNAALPMPTRIVMGLCEFMGNWWWAVLAAVAGLIASFVSYARSKAGRQSLDQFWLKLPVVGTIIQKYEMAKFARTLGTLFDNGVPVLRALRVTSDTLTNVAISGEVTVVHGRVTEGDSISESLRHTKHFPPMVVSMFAVGEESGRLGAVTKRIADAYDMEVDRAVKAMTALFEPILIVVMGVIIGFLVIAMLLPMLTLSSHVG